MLSIKFLSIVLIVLATRREIFKCFLRHVSSKCIFSQNYFYDVKNVFNGINVGTTRWNGSKFCPNSPPGGPCLRSILTWVPVLNEDLNVTVV